LRSLSGGDTTFEKQLLTQFLQQAPEEINQLETALENKEFEAIKQTAHSLKSTIGYVGLADELNPFLTRIEEGANSRQVDHLQVDYDYVKSRCDAAVTEVETILQNGSL
jgi:chemotaxis protein histidine kinase CheA